MSGSAIDQPRTSAEVVRYMRLFARFCGVAAALIGGLVLLGWLVHSDLLRAILAGWSRRNQTPLWRWCWPARRSG